MSTQEPQTEEKAKRTVMSGTGVELYVDKAFPFIKGEQVKVSIEPRKRRDVDPNAPFAGAYVRNGTYKVGEPGNEQERVTHGQLVSVDVFNQIRALNNLEPLSVDDVRNAAPQYDENGQKVKNGALLAGKKQEPLVFRANVFTQEKERSRDGAFSYAINPKSIQATGHPDVEFSFENEARLEAEKQAERKAQREAKQQQQESGLEK